MKTWTIVKYALAVFLFAISFADRIERMIFFILVITLAMFAIAWLDIADVIRSERNEDPI